MIDSGTNLGRAAGSDVTCGVWQQARGDECIKRAVLAGRDVPRSPRPVRLRQLPRSRNVDCNSRSCHWLAVSHPAGATVGAGITAAAALLSPSPPGINGLWRLLLAACKCWPLTGHVLSVLLHTLVLLAC